MVYSNLDTSSPIPKSSLGLLSQLSSSVTCRLCPHARTMPSLCHVRGSDCPAHRTCPCFFLPASPAGRMKLPVHTYSCVMGRPFWRAPRALNLLHTWASVPAPRVPCPLPETWFGKASPQAGEEACGDARVAVARKQHLAWASIAVPR